MNLTIENGGRLFESSPVPEGIKTFVRFPQYISRPV